jgi:hypothetical protein
MTLLFIYAFHFGDKDSGWHLAKGVPEDVAVPQARNRMD